MPLIKHNQAQSFTHDAVVLDLSDLHRQAMEILDRAQRQADEITARAQQEAQQLIDAADERGYAQGYERGLKEGLEQGKKDAEAAVAQSFQPQITQITDSWSRALEAWDAQREVLLSEAKSDVLRFAFELGQRIVHRMVALQPELVGTQLQQALNLLAEPTSLIVLVHPDDQPLIERMLPDLLSRFAREVHAHVRQDSSMQRGGCRLQSELGSIDARIEQQLDRLAEALLPADDASIYTRLEASNAPQAELDAAQSTTNHERSGSPASVEQDVSDQTEQGDES